MTINLVMAACLFMSFGCKRKAIKVNESTIHPSPVGPIVYAGPWIGLSDEIDPHLGAVKDID
jgi:hypothetical protein